MNTVRRAATEALLGQIRMNVASADSLVNEPIHAQVLNGNTERCLSEMRTRGVTGIRHRSSRYLKIEEHKIIIPLLFANDRYSRDLPLGKGKWSSRGFVAIISEADLLELLSDAEHYCNGGVDAACVDKRLVASARKTADLARQALGTGVSGR